MSRIHIGKAAGLQPRRKRSPRQLASPKANRARLGGRASKGQLTISKELINDRLACILTQMRKGCAEQVLLHTGVIASTLTLDYPNAKQVRDIVHEALAWFMRGNRQRAAQRLQEAINAWNRDPGQVSELGHSASRSQAARA